MSKTRDTGPQQSREGRRNLIRMLRQGFPDLSYSAVQMVDDGAKVWAHFRSPGTHEGIFMGQGPTRKRIDIDVIDIARLENGVIVEHWGEADRLKVLQQLGTLPARPGAGTPAT
jgi:predicted ester cyclase